MNMLLSLCFTSFLMTNVYTITVDESSTGALLSFPSIIDGSLFNKTYEVAPAHFGYQKYGGKLEGILILPANKTYHDECPKTNTNPEGPEPLGINPYIHYINDWFISDNDITNYILIVDRSSCYFVEQIEHAQLMGASGVIVCDKKIENLFTMWMPQNWKDDINIPSVLLSNANCHTLMKHIGVTMWNPVDITTMKYPTTDIINWTNATIEWGLPHPDDTVEYELWTSSNDYLGSRFKRNFNTTAIELDKAGDTVFTPHMYILNGSHWGCDDPNTLTCTKQCSNSGRYCAVDPEYDTAIGLDGIDVIQENLRSLCVWKYDKANFGNDDVMWWDYAVLWDENCGIYSNSSENFDANCSFVQMDKLKGDGSLSSYVKQCIIDSGGYGYLDGKNKILETETKLKYNSSIYAVPMVRINEFLIHGNIDCEPPVTTSSCQVLAAICAGFIENEPKPDVCMLTPSPTIVTCNDTEKDCNGICYGSYLTDLCGQCLSISSLEWNSCIGCNGIVNATYDCAGVCGGHYAVNICGYCKDTRSVGWDTFGVDCEGGCSMKKTDLCGHCFEESNPEWNDCIDCDQVAFGGKELNECGFCLDPNIANFENYGKDCRGICEGGWTLDRCGKCLSTTNITRDSCVGCDNVPYSNKQFNECGVCLLQTDPNFNDYGKDCRGICASSVANTYYIDMCGQCLLPSDSKWNNCSSAPTNLPTIQIPTFSPTIKPTSGTTYDPTEVPISNNPTINPIQSTYNTLRPTPLNGRTRSPTNKPTYLPTLRPTANPTQSTYTTLRPTPLIGQTHHPTDEPTNNPTLRPTANPTYNTLRPTPLNGQTRSPTDEPTNNPTLRPTITVCVGNNQLNECGRCALKTDANFNDYGRDCKGICIKSEIDNYYIDECGQCLLTSDSNWNNCLFPKTTKMPSSEPTEERVIITTETKQLTMVEATDQMETIIVSKQENKNEVKKDGISFIMILLLIIIGALVLLLCLCGVYLFYVKYEKKKNVHLDYVQNIQMDMNEDINMKGDNEDINIGEHYHEEHTEGETVYVDESDQTTALAQTNKL